MLPIRSTRASRAPASMPQSSPKPSATYTPKGTKIQAAMWALQAFWHPDTAGHCKSKWAEIY
eukprot:7125026-Prymnesium_polylepis.1